MLDKIKSSHLAAFSLLVPVVIFVLDSVHTIFAVVQFPLGSWLVYLALAGAGAVAGGTVFVRGRAPGRSPWLLVCSGIGGSIDGLVFIGLAVSLV